MKKYLSIIIIALVFTMALAGCGKVKNSSSSDTSAIAGTAEFVSAVEVLSNKCLSCHSTWASYSAAEYIKKGLVFKGSPANSSLYIRIRGNDTGQAGDMPTGQPNLSVTEIRTIKEWIESM